MCTLLQVYEDLSTFQTELKKTTRDVVAQCYPLFPKEPLPKKRHQMFVKRAAETLLSNGLYLRGEPDEEVGVKFQGSHL